MLSFRTSRGRTRFRTGLLCATLAGGPMQPRYLPGTGTKFAALAHDWPQPGLGHLRYALPVDCTGRCHENFHTLPPPLNDNCLPVKLSENGLRCVNTRAIETEQNVPGSECRSDRCENYGTVKRRTDPGCIDPNVFPLRSGMRRSLSGTSQPAYKPRDQPNAPRA